MIMKKGLNSKKLIALLVAFVTMLALAMPAFADEAGKTVSEAAVEEKAAKGTKKVFVTFFVNGERVDRQRIVRGKAAKAPADPEAPEGFYFAGWDKDFSHVKKNLKVNAVFAKIGTDGASQEKADAKKAEKTAERSSEKATETVEINGEQTVTEALEEIAEDEIVPENAEPETEVAEPVAEASEELPENTEAAAQEEAEAAEAAEEPEENEESEAEEAEEKPQSKRSVSFSSSHGGRSVENGTVITLRSNVKGFENVQYSVHWQYSDDGGATVHDAGIGNSLSYVANEENAGRLWRIVIVEED